LIFLIESAFVYIANFPF